jgi:cell division protein FtsB
MSTAKHGRFEDVGVGVRLKITSLWIAMLFLFAYGDIFGFFAPGRIEEIQGGRISGLGITQTFLLAVAVYIAIASAMVFLTLVLRPAANRWANIVVAALYIVSIVASMFGEDAYFVFLGLAEIAMLGLIVWYAWTWPERSPADGP